MRGNAESTRGCEKNAAQLNRSRVEGSGLDLGDKLGKVPESRVRVWTVKSKGVTGSGWTLRTSWAWFLRSMSDTSSIT